MMTSATMPTFKDIGLVNMVFFHSKLVKSGKRKQTFEKAFLSSNLYG